ncbi:hypothetical protein KDL01_12595 [Actinospica durhamensis]|uniref:Uncharacterized protein n=1 Tax=Actinospica durhamensis TaxID=1508375 RepID=A0A941EKF7_9ACTN|nr:hypothetical protein [Actinospica durhamensis]MBR7834110.1 hypothetical protein [Actinospica durhamensis]
MRRPDPLLEAISKDASGEHARSDPYRVSVLVGGALLTGYVFSSGAFVDDALPADLAAAYRQQRLEDDAAEYLHLHTDETRQGAADASMMDVRIPLDRVDAWWIATPIAT